MRACLPARDVCQNNATTVPLLAGIYICGGSFAPDVSSIQVQSGVFMKTKLQ